MKPRKFVFFLLFLSLLLNTFNLFGEEEDKKETMLLTAKLLINELAENLKSKDLNTDFLYSEILSDKTSHLKRRQSKDILQEKVKEDLARYYMAEANGVLNELNASAPSGSSGWFNAKTKNSLLKIPDSAIQKCIRDNFDQTFEVARTKACEQQWNILTKQIYPSEEEIEQFNSEELVSLLNDKFIKNQKEELFEENKKNVEDKIIRPLVEDAKKQLEKQLDIVGRSNGGKEIVLEKIQAYMNLEINLYRQDLLKQRQGKKRVYKIFPSVVKKVSSRAEEVTLEKFCNSFSHGRFRTTKNEIKKTIKSDLKKHSLEKSSKKECVNFLFSKAIKRLIKSHIKNLKKADQKDLSEFLTRAIKKEHTASRKIKNYIERGLDLYFQSARREISRKQFSNIFSPLEDGSWSLSYLEIENYESSTSNSYYRIDNPFEQMGISKSKFNKQELLEETQQKVADKVDNLLIEGVNALKNQLKIAETVGDSISKALKKKFVLPGKNKLISSYTNQVEKKWQKQRIYLLWKSKAYTLPANSSKKYAELFPKVKKRIEEKVANMLLEENKRVIASQKKPQKKENQRAPQYIPPVNSQPVTPGDNNLSSGNFGDGKDKGVKKSWWDKLFGWLKSLFGSGSRGRGSGGKGSGDGTGSGKKDIPDNKKDLEADLFVDVDYDGQAIEISLILRKTSFFDRKKNVFSFKVPADLYQNKINLDAFSDQMTEFFRNWINSESSKEGKKEIYVVTRVFEGLIDYGIIFEIRNSVKKAVKRIKVKKMDVYWLDTLIERKHKGKRRVPFEFKEKSIPMT